MLGGPWGYLLRKRTWGEQEKHSLFRPRYEEGTKFLDELAVLIGKRHYLLQRLDWAIELGDQDLISHRECEYFKIVTEWNSTYWKNRNKIRLLIDEKHADQYLEYGDIFIRETPKCLHYKFVVAHRNVLAAKDKPAILDQARLKVAELNIAYSVLLERLTTEFLKRASSLQLLDVPSGPGAAEVQHKEPRLVVKRK